MCICLGKTKYIAPIQCVKLVSHRQRHQQRHAHQHRAHCSHTLLHCCTISCAAPVLFVCMLDACVAICTCARNPILTSPPTSPPPHTLFQTPSVDAVQRVAVLWCAWEMGRVIGGPWVQERKRAHLHPGQRARQCHPTLAGWAPTLSLVWCSCVVVMVCCVVV